MTYIRRKSILPKAKMKVHIKFKEYVIKYDIQTNYQRWILDGNIGTVEDYFYECGHHPTYPYISGYNERKPVEQWIAYSSGQDGWNAYNSAVASGFEGSITDWLISFLSDLGLRYSGAPNYNNYLYAEWRANIGSGAYMTVNYMEINDGYYKYSMRGTIDCGDGKALVYYGHTTARHLYPSRDREYDIVINANLTNMQGFFYGNDKTVRATHIEFPTSCETIIGGSYSDTDDGMYSELSSVIIPETVKTIGSLAFYRTALTSVTIASDCVYAEDSFPPNCQINYY